MTDKLLFIGFLSLAVFFSVEIGETARTGFQWVAIVMTVYTAFMAFVFGLKARQGRR